MLYHMNTLPLLTLYSEGILSLLRRLHALIEIFIKDFYFIVATVAIGFFFTVFHYFFFLLYIYIYIYILLY